MDLVQLRYFQAVARAGNVTRAARELYVTQPNLSKSISRLEDELGVPLFEHRKGKILLNDYGRVFLSSVDIAFSELASGTQTIQRMYETNQHILSLACNISGYLPDVLPHFSVDCLDVGIRQWEYSSQQMVEHLLDRSITLAISNERLEDDMIVFQEIGRKVYVAAVHQDHPVAKQDSVALADLKNETFICDNSRLNVEVLRRECQKRGFEPRVGYEIQSSELIYHLLESDRGVAIMPIVLGCQIIQNHPDSPVKLLSIRDELPPVLLGVAWHRNFQQTQASRQFLDFLKRRLEEEDELIRSMGFDPDHL